MKITWSPLARTRALEAVDYIAVDRPLAAASWLEGLLERIDLLRDLPEQGRVVPEWPESGVRELVYSPFRIVCEIVDDEVVILTLRHFRQRFHEDGPEGAS